MFKHNIHVDCVLAVCDTRHCVIEILLTRAKFLIRWWFISNWVPTARCVVRYVVHVWQPFRLL